MNKIFTYTIISLAVLGLCGAVALGAQAETANGNYSPIIQKLIERFNLDADKVDEVLAEARAEKQQQMQVRMEQKLDKAVAEGKLTAEQKQTILEKKAEWQKNWQELKELSPKEQRAKMQEIKQEMKTWAEEQGIDLKSICQFGKFGKFGKFHRGFGQRIGR